MARLITRRFKLGLDGNGETNYLSGDLFLCRGTVRQLFAIPGGCQVIWVSLWDRPGPNRVMLAYIDGHHLLVDGERTWMNDETVEFILPYMAPGAVCVQVEYEG